MVSSTQAVLTATTHDNTATMKHLFSASRTIQTSPGGHGVVVWVSRRHPRVPRGDLWLSNLIILYFCYYWVMISCFGSNLVVRKSQHFQSDWNVCMGKWSPKQWCISPRNPQCRGQSRWRPESFAPEIEKIRSVGPDAHEALELVLHQFWGNKSRPVSGFWMFGFFGVGKWPSCTVLKKIHPKIEKQMIAIEHLHPIFQCLKLNKNNHEHNKKYIKDH